MGVDRNYTYHVDRGKFDLILFQHANKFGAAVYEGVRVSSRFRPENPVVKFAIGRNEGMRCDVSMVVDASGRQTFPRQPAQTQGAG